MASEEFINSRVFSEIGYSRRVRFKHRRLPSPNFAMITCVIILALLSLLIATDPEPGESRSNDDIPVRVAMPTIHAPAP